MAKHNELGITGEELAVNYLITKGYSIRERNWRSGHKELDIVAMTENELVIVEVKTRRNNDYGNPEDAVNNKKIKRIVAATDAYIKRNRLDIRVRFDIITILYDNKGFYSIEHLEDAFFAPVW